MEDLYRCTPIVRFPLGGSFELVYFPLGRSAQILSPPEVKTASLCSQFRKLSEHVARLQQAMQTVEATPPDLAALAQRGLLLSSSELLDRFSDFEAVAPGQLGWFAIPTSSRPAELERAIPSYASNFARFGRKPKILIADDSPPDEQASTAKAAQLGLQVADSSLTCWYMGPNEKRRLIDLLTEDGEIPRDVVEFGLCPGGDMPKMGANRNTIQMCTAGEMLLTADDDTICQPCFAPGAGDLGGLRLGSEIDPTEFWFFPDHGAALAAARFAELDIAAEHEKVLGRQVWTVLRDSGPSSSFDLNTLCTHLLCSLWSGQGQIAVTASGCVGDSGMHSTRGLRYHEGRGTRERLVASESDYRLALRSRVVIRQAPNATICHGTPFSTMFVGLDNRQLLPPFLPIGRNEDGVFACALNRCIPDGYFGYLPWSLVHAPTGSREYNTAVETRISEVVIACITTWNSSSTAGAEKRLQSLGRHLVELASAPPEAFREAIFFSSWGQASFRVAKAESQLNAFAYSPSYWAEDVVKEIESILAAITRPDFALPSDLRGSETHELLARTQNIVRRYGELLYWWPAMIERATELAANDQLPIRRI